MADPVITAAVLAQWEMPWCIYYCSSIASVAFGQFMSILPHFAQHMGLKGFAVSCFTFEFTFIF